MTIRLRRVLLVLALTGAAALGVFLDLPAFLRAWLLGWLMWLGVALGAFSLLCVHHLVGGRWGAAIRPTLAAASETLPVLAVLFVPVALGARAIFPWTDPALLHATPLRAAKAAYLDGTFFLARSIVALALWSALGVLLARVPADRLRPGLAALGLIVHFLAITSGSVDWILSLDPDTSSSAFGLTIAAGDAVAGLAFAVLIAAAAPLKPSPARVHDLATMLFTCVMLWAYVAFAQFLLVWAADLPRQAEWYLARSRGAWSWIAGAIAILHFAVPFLLLLFRPIKRHLPFVAAIGALLLFMHFVELCWLVLPARALLPGEARTFHWLDVVVPLALGAWWFLLVSRRLTARRVEVLPP